MFHYTRCITPKRITSRRDHYPRYCAFGQHSSFRRNVAVAGGELLKILFLIWLARDLNLRPPTPETNALPLDHSVQLIYITKLQTLGIEFLTGAVNSYLKLIELIIVL